MRHGGSQEPLVARGLMGRQPPTEEDKTTNVVIDVFIMIIIPIIIILILTVITMVCSL